MFSSQFLIPNYLDKYIPFDLNYLPSESYLVGGVVRDILLERKKDYLDLDFVLPTKTIEIARQIANKYKVGFVILDAERNIARVVFPGITCDFAEREGESLEADLRRRDFTINAIAYSFDEAKICDPAGGLLDLKQGIIRMISAQNLQDDPLRLLRGYRQAAQLNFTLESVTESTIKELAPTLKQVARERVKSELNYLLNSPRGSYWLEKAFRDQILLTSFPSATADRVASLTEIDRVADVINNRFGVNIANSVALAKLTLFLSPSPSQAEIELLDIKASSLELRLIITALTKLDWLKTVQHSLTLREQYFLFLATKDSFIILAILCLIFDLSQLDMMSLLERYFKAEDPIAHPKIIVTGNDLMEHLNIKPSPVIKTLLTEISLAYAEGKIITVQEALTLARNIVEDNPLF